MDGRITRFQGAGELNKLMPLLDELRARDRILENAIGPGDTTSIAYLKHQVLHELIQSMDRAIDYFNAQPSHANAYEEAQDIKQLAATLLFILQETYDNHETLLLTNRDQYRFYASVAMRFFFVSSVATVTTIASASIVGGSVGALAAAILGESINRGTGWNDTRPRSAVIMIELTKILLDINPELMNQLNSTLASTPCPYASL